MARGSGRRGCGPAPLSCSGGAWQLPRSRQELIDPTTMPIPSLLRRHFPHRAIQTGVMTRTRWFHPGPKSRGFFGCWLCFGFLFFFSCEASPGKRGDAVRDGHPQPLGAGGRTQLLPPQRPPRLCFRNNPNTIPERTDFCSDTFKGEWAGFERALTGSLVNLC